MPLPRPAPGTGRWWLIGTVTILAAVLVIIWVGLAGTLEQVRVDVRAYHVASDSQVSVEYEVWRPKDRAIRCVITAIDSQHGRVGTVSDDIPAGPDRSVRRAVTVRTSARAVTGVVDSCVRVGAGG